MLPSSWARAPALQPKPLDEEDWVKGTVYAQQRSRKAATKKTVVAAAGDSDS
jgi:hypothetical protein